VINLYISRDGQRDEWVHWETVRTEMRAGRQVFRLREKLQAGMVGRIRVEVVRAHGDKEKTYINQVR